MSPPSRSPDRAARERPGPGPVAAVHRILIVAALVCAVLYAAWEASQWTRTSETAALARAALALGVAGAIALYLRSLRGLAAKLTPPSRKHP